MYIEQGYKGEIGLWKYLFLPIGFMLFMIYNYIMTLQSPISVEEMMHNLIDQLGMNLVLILVLAPLAVGLFIVLGWTKLVHAQTITSLTTARKKVDWKRIGFAFFVWAIITIVVTLIFVYLSPDDFVFNFQLRPFIFLAIIGIFLIPLQTSFEEYMFRGHMMQGLGLMAKNRWVPLVVTSVLFGLMHLGNPEVGKLGYGIMIYYIGTGFFLGILTLMDEGLELALGFHAANNLIGALLMTSDWSAFQTNSIYKDISTPVLGWDILILIFVVYPVLLFLFGKKYKWTNWKEKLTGKVYSKSEILEANEQNIPTS